jgi:alkanesulfonate monooxygenase SsuD/methylene tetrahydromethanopterin reductase-like flavin-dependent oxidoreductase (luciferase family)
MAARHARVVEVLDRCDVLWDTGRDPKWTGFPLPLPRPQVLLGVNSVALAEVAGRRCEALNVRLGHPGLPEFFAAAVEARRTSARAGTPFTLTGWTSMTPESLDPAGDIQGEFAALGGRTLILVR